MAFSPDNMLTLPLFRRPPAPDAESQPPARCNRPESSIGCLISRFLATPEGSAPPRAFLSLDGIQRRLANFRGWLLLGNSDRTQQRPQDWQACFRWRCALTAWCLPPPAALRCLLISGMSCKSCGIWSRILQPVFNGQDLHTAQGSV